MIIIMITSKPPLTLLLLLLLLILLSLLLLPYRSKPGAVLQRMSAASMPMVPLPHIGSTRVAAVVFHCESRSLRERVSVCGCVSVCECVTVSE